MAELSGAKLLAMREVLKVNQQSLADHLDIYKQTVHDVESGKINVDYETLRKWSQALLSLHDQMQRMAKAQSEEIKELLAA